MPHPHLTELYKIYQSETQPFRKVHRMIDLFESLIKMHTVVIIAEYVGHNKLSDAAKGMLAQGLRTPSLGTWQLFSRILFEELQQDDGYQWTFNGFAADFIQLDKSLNDSKTNVIAFRNGYAHGATPTDAQCSSDISQYEPFLLQLLQSPWLQSTHTEHRDQQVWISTDTGQLCLHPILLFKEEGGASPYAFFNDLKNDKVGLLNYPLSKHYREKDFYKEFHQYLPLHEWKKSGNNEFYQRIEELTETFKGRSAERERLLQFVTSRNKGYLSIQGNPGIGKSALIARFFKDLKANEQTKSIQVVEYFIRRGTAQAQVDYLFNYLIRRTDELFPEGREIRAEGRATWELQQQLFSKWRLWSEKSNGSKLLMLIDGLDEGTENNVVTYLPRENFEGILIIYGSRPGGHKSIDELWTQLPVEHHDKLELTGLGKSDIRALIYEVSNKYELDRESEWIDAVQQRSQGNPLYLKLLCDAIEQGSIALNDIHALPEKIDEYYKAILDRYAADVMDGDALLNALFTFAAAKDYLTMAHIGLINRLGEAALQRIGSTLKEVLYENPLTEAVLDYQLFHESFREYLYKEKARQVNDAAERIIDFCNGWKELEGSWEQRYALEYLSAHLSESKREARAEALIRLIYDKDYVQTQQKVLKQFESSNTMYRHALKKAGALKLEEDMLEAALSLVDLKYAEANDAPQVVAMVASGDIDHALKRIESFGGNDKEGLQRKFTLYMLCLMELTLLDSKDKPFRKSAIEKLLNHLDEKLPTDDSILRWWVFFPSYLMFQMAFQWAGMGLDYLRVYKRTDNWESDWIVEVGPYSDLQFEILCECARGISDEFRKIDALKAISSELAKQGQVKAALSCAGGISDDRDKSSALKDISSELVKQGKVEAALACAGGISDDRDKSSALREISSELMKQGKVEAALACAGGISDDRDKSSALREISSELMKQGKVEEALSCAREIIEAGNKIIALRFISTELAKQGKVEEALSCAREISYGDWKIRTLAAISTKLAKKGDVVTATSVLQEAHVCAREIDEPYTSSALAAISTELAKQGKVEEALSCAQEIRTESRKSSALADISCELVKQGHLEEAASAMQEALSCACGISDDRDNSYALKAISSELAKQGKVEAALSCARGISDDRVKSSVLIDISSELAKQGQVEEALSCARWISDEWSKSLTLAEISTESAKQGKVEAALSCAREISYDDCKIRTLQDISSELAKQGKVEEALSCAREIIEAGNKIIALKFISTELAKQGKMEASSSLMEEALFCACGIIDELDKSSALMNICAELVKQVKVEAALSCACGISDDRDKSYALKAISIELSKQGQVEEAASAIKEALSCTSGISDEWKKREAIKTIIPEVVKQGKVEEALSCARGISDEWTSGYVLMDISTELAKQGKVEEALSCAREISYGEWKISTLAAISTKLAKKGDVVTATSVLQEAHVCAREIDEPFTSSALVVISNELAKQGMVEEALSCAQEIRTESRKSSALAAISTELAKQGKVEEALSCAQEIRTESRKSSALAAISTELAKQGKVEEALSCARGISDESDKSSALSAISTELAKQGKVEEAEDVGLEIPQIAERHFCWKQHAESGLVTHSWQSALSAVQGYKSDEARIFYLKGWSEKVAVKEVNAECLNEALPYLVIDTESIESLLQRFAQQEISLGHPTSALKERLNRTLNVQWLIDIAAQFPKAESAKRLSTNFKSWINSIEDEDDREEIELLARKVAKGKMTEEEFGERLKEF